MILLTLEKRGDQCRVELDGVDITKRLQGFVIEANVNSQSTVRLYIRDEVTIIGEPGRFEFVKNVAREK